MSKKDTLLKQEDTKIESGGIMQTAIVLCVFVLISGIGYSWRHAIIQSELQTISIEMPPDSISISGSHASTQRI